MPICARHICIKYKTKGVIMKTPPNNNKKWTSQQVVQLKSLAKGNTPTGLMGLKMGRSESSISSKASTLRISLKPTNKSPYGTQKRK